MGDNTVHIPEVVIKKRKPNKPHALAKKTREAMKLVHEHGLEPKNALMLVTGNPKPHRNTVTKFAEKCAKWSIERPAVQKIAHNTLAAFAAGKEVNGVIPKASDVKAAAERIIDQVTPIVRRTENLNVNVDICPVDLSKYRKDGL